VVAASDVTLILLAAGRSERFGGAESKLDEDLWGRPLGLHVVHALRELPFAARIAVTGRCRIDYAAEGFAVVRNDAPEVGLSGSLRIGVGHAVERGARAVLIVLADMPCVTAAHVRRLMDAGDTADAVIASTDGTTPRPPVLFGRHYLRALTTLSGDAGARAMIRAGRHIVADAGELIDVDTVADLERLRKSRRWPDSGLGRMHGTPCTGG
jgi:molybdenum cofactor cytidylyltransferase